VHRILASESKGNQSNVGEQGGNRNLLTVGTTLAQMQAAHRPW